MIARWRKRSSCSVVFSSNGIRAVGGDNKLGEVLGGDLAEMIKGKSGKSRAAEDSHPDFASLEEIVADRLLAAMNEYRDVPENDKNAAVHEVTLTIEAARLHESGAL